MTATRGRHRCVANSVVPDCPAGGLTDEEKILIGVIVGVTVGALGFRPPRDRHVTATGLP